MFRKLQKNYSTATAIGRKKSRNKNAIILSGLLFFVAFLLSGCGDFFDEKTAFMQSQHTREKIRERSLAPVVDPNASLPSVYQAPPEIIEQVVGGMKEFKLFYFCRYHRADELEKIVIAKDYNEYNKFISSEKGMVKKIKNKIIKILSL